MHHRYLFPLAAGIVGLMAISPILADPPSASAAGSKPKPTKATTSSTRADTASGSGADSASNSGTDPGNGSGADSNAGSGSGKGSGSSPAPDGKGGSSGSSPTTNPGAGSGHTSSTTCNPPETNQGPAPQMGEPAQTHEAGPAGTVDVERLSDTELRVAKATPNDGWVEQVSAPSGPRVTVKFTRQGQSPTLIRFAASMDQKGTMIHIRVTSCG
jgi:hypothetical protein